MSKSKKDGCVTNFGQYITSEYEILRRVFLHLSLPQLKKCAAVCKQWKNMSELIIKARRTVQCIVLKKGETPFLMSDAELTFVFSKNPLKDNIFYLDSRLFVKFEAFHGIFYTSPNSEKLLIRGTRKYSALSQIAIRFPPQDGVIVRTVFIPNTRRFTRSEIKDALNIPDGVPIKGVIMLSYCFTEATETNQEEMLSYLFERENGFALAGLRLSGADCVCGGQFIIFAGDSVEAASCVLEEGDLEDCDVKSKLEKLHGSVTAGSNRILLAFRCFERKNNRQANNDIENREATMFTQIFPSCLMIGCYGDGEFGMNFPLHTQDGVKPIKRIRHPGSVVGFEYAYSTVYFYIGYNK